MTTAARAKLNPRLAGLADATVATLIAVATDLLGEVWLIPNPVPARVEEAIVQLAARLYDTGRFAGNVTGETIGDYSWLRRNPAGGAGGETSGLITSEIGQLMTGVPLNRNIYPVAF